MRDKMFAPKPAFSFGQKIFFTAVFFGAALYLAVLIVWCA